jgi:hypothetical protein
MDGVLHSMFEIDSKFPLLLPFQFLNNVLNRAFIHIHNSLDIHKEKNGNVRIVAYVFKIFLIYLVSTSDQLLMYSKYFWFPCILFKKL